MYRVGCSCNVIRGTKIWFQALLLKYNRSMQLLGIEMFGYNNNNQAFYSQASWGRLQMKLHEQKKKQVQNKSKK
jgi:hypothetical protein